MTIAWTLYVLLVGTLLACAALAVDGILRRTTLPTRWVWVSALAGIICFALIAPTREATRTAFKIPDATYLHTTDLTPTSPNTIVAFVARARDVVSYSGTKLIAAANTQLPDSGLLWISIVWGAMSAVMLSVIIIVNRRVARERHAWPRAEVCNTPVRITPSVGPAVIGLSMPEIVVPRWLLERNADEQRLVIVHEREHVAARDQLLPVGGLIVAALLPWHPAVWWALSRLRLAIELDCDARVLNHGVQPRPYGALLIDIAGQCAGHRVGALALADRTSHLERRLLAMKNTQPRFTLVRTAALGAVAMLSIVMACEARLPTSAEVEKMDVASAEKSMVMTKMLDEKAAKNTVYTVDGMTVTADRAHAIQANRIATLNVSKGTLLNTKDSGLVTAHVYITTLDGVGKGESMKVAYRTGMVPTRAGGDVKFKTAAGKGFDGLLYVDGVLAPEGTLAKLSPNDIVSVEVIKGAAAARISSDPAALNGVIQVKTKNAKQ
jgi:beta-lactamase regulating signal transducer with metallopeptidase domain